MILRFKIFRRSDGKWAYSEIAGNGRIIGTDGGQGYNHLRDVARVLRGKYDGLGGRLNEIESAVDAARRDLAEHAIHGG